MKWTDSEISFLKENIFKLSNKELSLYLSKSYNAIAKKIGTLKFLSREIRQLRANFFSNNSLKFDNWDEFLFFHTLKFTNLPNIEFQLLLGSMLGDAWINRNKKSFELREEHCDEQYDYLVWKRNLLSRFRLGKIYKLKGGSHYFSTITHPVFLECKNNFYNGDGFKTNIPMDWCSKIDPLGLLIWYLDNGCPYNKSGYTIACAKFKQEQLLQVCNILNSKFNIKARLRINSKIYSGKNFLGKNLVFDKYNINNYWENIFIKYDIPKCMRYKLI